MTFNIQTAKIVSDRYEPILKGLQMPDNDRGFTIHRVAIVPTGKEARKIFTNALIANNFDWEIALLISGYHKESVAIELHSYNLGVMPSNIAHSDLDWYLERNKIEKDYSI